MVRSTSVLKLIHFQKNIGFFISAYASPTTISGLLTTFFNSSILLDWSRQSFKLTKICWCGYRDADDFNTFLTVSHRFTPEFQKLIFIDWSIFIELFLGIINWPFQEIYFFLLTVFVNSLCAESATDGFHQLIYIF